MSGDSWRFIDWCVTVVVLPYLCAHLESWRYPIPTLFMFAAAFSSRLCSTWQCKHWTDRTFKSNFPHLKPQFEQTWLVGSHLPTTMNSLPNFSDLASQSVLNSLHPCWLIALDNLRFLTISDTFKSSKIITWFSFSILVDNLCKKSWRVSAIRLWSLAILILVISLLLESFGWRARFTLQFTDFLV
jgi:hypothetical protein